MPHGRLDQLSPPPSARVELSPDESQPEPGLDAPVEFVRLTTDGTETVSATGDIRVL